MLKVRYQDNDQLAEISTSEPSALFSSIRRACEDRSTGVINESGVCFKLPWWAFLSCRGAIGVILRQHDAEIEFDNEARARLVAAKRRENSYREAAPTRTLLPEDVQQQLWAKGFTRRLTPEQLRNVSRIVGLPAAASFSVPGAGKTTEALAYYFLRSSDESQLLVVAPKNAFAAWEEQLQDCAPSTPLRFTRLVGGFDTIAQTIRSNPKLALVTYHQLPNVLDLIARYISQKPTLMILDESHRMKRGAEGVHGRSLLGICHLPEHKLILSGTPMPNSLSDLVPQFDFLYPEIRATEGDVKQKIQPIYVRTTKPELRLPPISSVRVEIPMNPAQQRLYELLRSETARELADIRSSDRIAIRKIGRSVMRLLQLVSNPSLLAQADFDRPELLQAILSEGGSPKMEWVCSRARTLARLGKKVVIWSGFIDNVEILAERLRDLGAVFIHGGVEAGSDADEDTREQRVRKFHQDPDSMVLVGNPAACGEGISLHTVCHHAIYLDRNYNAAQFLQSQDRIHRLGLPPSITTTIEIAFTPGSIDESVDRRLSDKIRLMSSVLNDPSLNIEPVSVDPDDLSMSERDLDDLRSHLAE